MNSYTMKRSRLEFGLGLSVLALALSLAALQGVAGAFEAALVVVPIALGFTALSLARGSRDYFHPLGIFVASFVVRLWLPALLIQIGVKPPPFSGNRWWIGDAWRRGFALASIANVSLVMGWLVTPRWKRQISRVIHGMPIASSKAASGLYAASWIGFGIGLFFYVFFFLINFGLSSQVIDVIISGVLRGGQAQLPGTSRYMFLAGNFLTWSSIILAVVTYRSRNSLWRSLIPLVVLVVLYLPFGGRVVSLTPLFIGLIALWYSGWRWKKAQALLASVLAIVLGLYIAPAVRAYRGGGGLSNFVEALSPKVVLGDNTLFWYELSMLHSYTYAIILGPKSHSVSLLRYLFGGYTAYFFGVLNEMVHGTYIIWQISGVKPDWGIHTGLPVDYYMSFGLIPMMVTMFILGALVKWLYTGLVAGLWPMGVLQIVLYVMLLWQAYWFVYERGLGLLSVWESLAFLAIISMVAKLLAGSHAEGVSAKPFPATTKVPRL